MDKRVWLVLIVALAMNIFSEEIVDTLRVQSDTIPDTLKEEHSDIVKVQASQNPFLYNKCVGTAMDGLIYSFPIMIYTISAYNKATLDTHNNSLIYCLSYPAGLVFVEKFIKNLYIHNPDISFDNAYSSVLLKEQLGIITPTTFSYDPLVPFQHFDARLFSVTAIQFDFNPNEMTSFIVRADQLDAMLSFNNEVGYRYHSIAIGAEFYNWSIYINKMFFGYGVNGVPVTFYGIDFWGVGIEWSKRVLLYKKLSIETTVAYRFSRSVYFDNSIIGIFSGMNIKYKF